MTSAHRDLLDHWPSAYAMAKETGVPLTTAKRWRRCGQIADPRWWIPLIDNAGRSRLQECYRLTRDYQEEKS